MNINDRPYSGVKTLIMGLGLHGGGLGAACFLAKHGAELSVTDLRDAGALQGAIETLDNYVKSVNGKPVKYTLERHDTQDFKNADIVIKNPGVNPASPFLQAARHIETDITLFLKHNPARLTAVTGSKGKSFTAAAIHYALQETAKTRGGKAFLGGNITVSPLNFLDELTPSDDVVLELSSWQLGDLPVTGRADGLLKPRAAVITAIMPDHLDRYGSMEAYVADKRIIYQAQDECDITIADDSVWGRGFLKETRGRVRRYGCERPEAGVSGAYFDAETGACFAAGPIKGKSAGAARIVPPDTAVPGVHQRMNLMAAGLALLDLGVPAALIDECAAHFPGIEHRLEFFYESGGVRFYNDTAATIPEAAAAAVRALGCPVVVTGGTDKNLDFAPLADALSQAAAVILLAGSGSDKLAALMKARGVVYSGPLECVAAAARAAAAAARPGSSVVLSPGCASFGMFLNEFDRGRKWKAAVIKNC